MPHPSLLQIARALPLVRELIERIPPPGEAHAVAGMPGAAGALTIAALHESLPSRAWLVTEADPERAEQVVADLDALLGEGAAAYFPQRETLPYEDADPHLEISGQRVEAVEAVLSGRSRILVTTPRAVQERMPQPADLDTIRLEVSTGQALRMLDLVERLEAMGFERASTVEEVGQIAVRGGLLDVFGFGEPEPCRIEFWGDDVESIRRFDILTQRSTVRLERIHILPVDFHPAGDPEAAEPSAQDGALVSVLDLLPRETVHIRYPRIDVSAAFDKVWTEVVRLYRAEREAGRPAADPDHLFMPPDVALAALGGLSTLTLQPAPDDVPEAADAAFLPPETIERDLTRLAEVLRDESDPYDETLILCDNQGQLERMEELLEDLRVAGRATLALGSLSGGFRVRAPSRSIRVLTDHEIFQRTRRLRRRRSFRGGAALESLAALKPGEYVVHLDHGIGRFREMERVRLGFEEFETLVIEYADGELLRVPVHRVDLIERWVDESDGTRPPKVHRVGGKEWKRTRRRTEQAIEEMASELLDLYARREAARGYAFSEDTRWQTEMESAFEFEDTPDQTRATEQIKADMESERPMDRLVCGDVGYGKTEVAMRAAFKAVQDDKQVAVLVPTTILAEQHAHTFQERLANFPVRIESLSRFRTPAQQRKVLTALADGAVDIVIGTHRLLSQDVHFHDLGLIVVDEEQRFGVRHKERLKALKETVDVLTLTATPIPRTLQFSLLGLRDMTLMETPPRDRQPIITHVLPWSDAILEDAMRRELDRAGQIFFVHDRIDTIDTVAHRVRSLVPDARVGVGHGQMREHQLEKVMTALLEGEKDVLVATSIIENGLDVPRANTLIVNRADRFGLAQLYQIRGRVGRSHHRAYCYLLVPDDVSEEAEKRLRILEHYTELGSGHRIALKDLELRGAGNLLGAEQSGLVHAVGLDTYTRLLERTVRKIREGESGEPQQAEVSVDGAALIPDSFVSDESQKLHLYRRLSRVGTLAEAAALEEEMCDRFGPIPREASQLLGTTRLRIAGTLVGVERAIVSEGSARLNFREAVVPRMTELQRVFTEAQLQVAVKRAMPLSLEISRAGVEPLLDTLVRCLAALAGRSSG